MSLGRAPARAPDAGTVVPARGTRVYNRILGDASADAFHDALHALEHAHAVDHLRMPRGDLSRRRLRAVTEKGQDVAIALPRDQQLFDGAVLALDDHAALVVRVETEQWLRLTARDQGMALRLGYFCGNLHWRVRFEDETLLIAIETEERLYLDRLAPMLDAGDVALAEQGGAP
jgi:urease accessory protein